MIWFDKYSRMMQTKQKQLYDVSDVVNVEQFKRAFERVFTNRLYGSKERASNFQRFKNDHNVHTPNVFDSVNVL
jgi:hypothetical protein